jgi:hypothetical protein
VDLDGYYAATRVAHDQVAEHTYNEQQGRQVPPPEKSLEERERDAALELFTRTSRDWNEQVGEAIISSRETQRQRRMKR